MSYKIIINAIPPSNNLYLGNNRSHWIYSSEKKRWEQLIRVAIHNANIKLDKPIKQTSIAITYYFKDKRRRDPDNYSGKFILDGLVRSGILKDDSFSNVDLILHGDYDRDNPRTEVLIVPYE